MNEENITRIESSLARAYKEGHYKENLEQLLVDVKPTLIESIKAKLIDMFS